MSDNKRYEKAYNPKEIADLLGIAPSTLRKWAKILEERNYHFIRDDQNRRVYIDRDAIALRLFSDLTKEKNLGLDVAADVVLQHFGVTQDVALSATEIPEQRHSERYEAILEVILEKMEEQEKTNQLLLDNMHRLEELNRALIEQLDYQQKYVNESLTKRDQRLVETIREIQETKLLIAASNSSSPSFWRKIFKKNRI